MDTSEEKNEENAERTESVNQAETEHVDDVSIECDSEFAEHSARQSKDVVADLRAKLKKSDDEKREYLTGWQRTKADFINSRKQDEEENKTRMKFAEAALLAELAPVLDSFEMAFSNKEALAKLPPEWLKGVEQIHSQFFNILSEHNVEIIDPMGESFDPRVAEAVGIDPVSDAEKDDMVTSVMQKGYKVHDRIIRPAKVRVGKHT